MSSTTDATPEMMKESDGSSQLLESPRFSCLLENVASPIKTITFCPEARLGEGSQGEINNQLQNIYLQLKERHQRTASAANCSPGKRKAINTPTRKSFESPLRANCISDSKALILKTNESQKKLLECVNKRRTAFLMDEFQKRKRSKSKNSYYSPGKIENIEEEPIHTEESKHPYSKSSTPGVYSPIDSRKTLGVSNHYNENPKTSNASTQVDFQAYLVGNSSKLNDTFGTPQKRPVHARAFSSQTNSIQDSTAVRYTLTAMATQATPKLKPDELYSLLNSDSSKILPNNSLIYSSFKQNRPVSHQKKSSLQLVRKNPLKQNPLVVCSNYKSLSPYKKRLGFSSGFDIENFIKRAKPLQ